MGLGLGSNPTRTPDPDPDPNPDPNPEQGEYDYTRSGNPTRDALQEQMADLEGATRSFAFTSGMAALTVAMRLVPSGGLAPAP